MRAYDFACPPESLLIHCLKLIREGGPAMLDGEHYFAAFPDERNEPRLEALLGALARLETEFRRLTEAASKDADENVVAENDASGQDAAKCENGTPVSQDHPTDSAPAARED